MEFRSSNLIPGLTDSGIVRLGTGSDIFERFGETVVGLVLAGDTRRERGNSEKFIGTASSRVMPEIG
jgi:hypothetical protein